MPAHRIRLHGPWEIRWITPAPPRPFAGESIAGLFLKPNLVRMPADWQTLFGPASGTVEFTRVFQWPTNLEPGEQAWLVFDGVGGAAQATLNGEPLGEVTETGRFEITSRLASANRLCVEVTFDPTQATIRGAPGGLHATVALELIDPADA
jgi:hypothetical protein